MADRIHLQGAAAAAAEGLSPERQFARDIYQELIEINTVTATGDTAKAAEAAGVRTRVVFFGKDSATALKAEGYSADLIAANNVLNTVGIMLASAFLAVSGGMLGLSPSVNIALAGVTAPWRHVTADRYPASPTIRLSLSENMPAG